MIAETSYNWDDIQVGSFDLNHSENFFTRKHQKHEKVSELFFSPITPMDPNETFTNDIASESMANKVNTEPVVSIKQENLKTIDHPSSPSKVQPKLEVSDQVQVAVESASSIAANPSSTSNIEVKPESCDQVPVTIKSPPSPSPSSIINRWPANLLTKFKTPQLKSNCGPTTSTTAIVRNGKATSKVEPPHAYDFKDIYKKKKEEMMKKLMEEEKKNRVFHSRPVPKSVAMPTIRRTHDYHLTAPKTPLVLKNSREADERRKQRLEEYKRQNPPQKFVSREALVLQKEPFKPKKTTQTVQPQPFKLSVERRLEERKQYDEQNRIAAEEKKKQEEEERKKREEELVKELRKLASFKARPNPFK